MKTPNNPSKMRPGHSSNAGRKKEPRLRIEAALKDCTKGLTRHELAALTDCSVTLINNTILSMLRSNCVHHDDSKPQRFFAGPAPHAAPAPDVVRGRSINIWTLPAYVPPAWHVREDAGRVRA